MQIIIFNLKNCQFFLVKKDLKEINLYMKSSLLVLIYKNVYFESIRDGFKILFLKRLET